MPSYKRCVENGCTKFPRCSHRWWIHEVWNNDRERGPVTNYLFLIPGQPEPEPPTEPTPEITIEALCTDYEKKHIPTMGCKATPSQVKRIKREFGAEPLDWLSDQRAIEDFLAELVEEAQQREKNPHSTRNRYRSRLSHLLTWSRQEPFKYTGASVFFHEQLNPKGIAKLKEGSGRHRRISKKELKAIERVLRKLDDGGVMLGRFYCALDCGLRRGEMLELRKEDVIWNHQGDGLYLRLRWTTTKSGEERYVPVSSPRLIAFLKKRRFAPFPFGQADGSRCSQFRIEWEQALIDAKIDAGHWEQRTTKTGKRYGAWVRTVDGNLHWHDFRHEYASRLHEKGVPMTQIRDLLGHHSVEVTEIYINAIDKDVKKRLTKIQKEAAWAS